MPLAGFSKTGQPLSRPLLTTPWAPRDVQMNETGEVKSNGLLEPQQPSQAEAYEEALLRKRIELVQQMQASLANDGHTIAHQSIAAYSHILDGNQISTLRLQWLCFKPNETMGSRLHPEYDLLHAVFAAHSVFDYYICCA